MPPPKPAPAHHCCIHVDGSALPNPGPMSLGVLLQLPDGSRHTLSQDLHRSGCNNEAELLALMARGLTNQDIAEQLRIALPTVKFHITNILSKLGVGNRTEAVLLALKHRLVPPAG